MLSKLQKQTLQPPAHTSEKLSNQMQPHSQEQQAEVCRK